MADSSKILASLTRIADLATRRYDLAPLPQSAWATGDYLEAVITGETSPLYSVESASGEMIPVTAGNRIVGALGERAATLEGTGSWRDVARGQMHCLTNAGLIGAFTSLSPFLPRPISLDYLGHVLRDGVKVTMSDFALQAPVGVFGVPTVLLVGTSMSAGKTATGSAVCRMLADAGLRVIGAKLTGAGRYRDILSFRAAGAAEVYDFVDVGLPSTVVDESLYRQRIRPLLRHIGSRAPDVLVAEAGASPLEPYNGATAIDELGANVRCTILCALDPYAVVGVMQAFGLQPDLVSGPATNTKAGVNLVRKLSGVESLNIADAESLRMLRQVLAAKLGVTLSAGGCGHGVNGTGCSGTFPVPPLW